MPQAPEQAALAAKRAAFEQHYQRTRGLNAPPERVGDGYRSERAHEAWVDWQAGAASGVPGSASGSPCAAARKTESQHRADFEMALKGNNLKRYHQVSHAAYMDAMIENMWHGWLRKARFDGTTIY